MRKAVRYTNQVSGLIVGLLIFAIGVAIIFLVPCFGWVIGPLLILLALTKGAKSTKVWRCKTCKYFFQGGERWPISISDNF